MRGTIRQRLLQVRLSDREHEALHDAARRDDQTIAELVRSALRREIGLAAPADGESRAA
jgi:hypothetical protein